MHHRRFAHPSIPDTYDGTQEVDVKLTPEEKDNDDDDDASDSDEWLLDTMGPFVGETLSPALLDGPR